MKTTKTGWWSVLVMFVGAREANAAVFASPFLAQVPGSLHTAFEYGLGILFLAGFLWGVLKIWGGADRMSKGDADGKMGIVSGLIIAGAASIMAALFGIFGMQGGALVPQF
jgi:fumarate reductase subunit D